MSATKKKIIKPNELVFRCSSIKLGSLRYDVMMPAVWKSTGECGGFRSNPLDKRTSWSVHPVYFWVVFNKLSFVVVIFWSCSKFRSH